MFATYRAEKVSPKPVAVNLWESLVSIFLTLLTLIALPVPAEAATYYACEAGYEFQASNHAARCFKAGAFESNRPRPCQDSQLHVDHQGRSDK